MKLGALNMTNNDKITELTNGEFDSFIKEGVVLIDFFAEWCMPCLVVSPILDDLSDKVSGKAKIGKVNVDDNIELARKFEVSSIPNFVIFKDGQKVDQFMGSLNLEDFEEKLSKYY